jgi:putative glutamine amidotransferase
MPKQTARPVIGLNMDYIPASKMAGPQLRLHAGYCESIYNAGGMPLVIPPVFKEKELEEFLDRCDGFLLTSGPLDMDPRRMGLNPHPAVQAMPAKREDTDRALCKLIVQKQMPCLAVALGMLELNVICGGSLFLHLPDDNPKAMPHKDMTGGVHRHIVLLEPKTRLDSIYGGGEIRVNSYHHQAVNQLASRFRVCGKAADGVIEAYEANDPNWFCMGIQWHPHSETASALDMQIIEALVASSAKAEMTTGLRLAA